jgi:hypothetical protein
MVARRSRAGASGQQIFLIVAVGQIFIFYLIFLFFKKINFQPYIYIYIYIYIFKKLGGCWTTKGANPSVGFHK